MAPEIDAARLDRALATPHRVVVVDLHDDACAPCLTQERFTDALAVGLRETADVYRLNLTQAPGFAARHGVAGLPAVALFKGGRLRRLFPGLTDPGALAAAAEALTKEP